MCCIVEQGDSGEGESSTGSYWRGFTTTQEEGEGGGREGGGSGRWTAATQEEAERGERGRRGETGDCHQRQLNLRTICLKKQCITKIKNVITTMPVTLFTRDAVVKLPTCLLMEVYKQLDMDLNENDCGAIFLLHEVMTQRTHGADHLNLFEDACVAFIRYCGTLTMREISYKTQNMSDQCLSKMTNLFPHEHWCAIISKVLSERQDFFMEDGS